MPDLEWRTERRKISALLPYSGNPRRLTEKQAEDLTKSLQKFNLVEIPAINSNGTILAGHQRLKIMQVLGRGEEEIDVRVPSRELTPDEEKEYLLRSNKNTGEWDWDLLKEFGIDSLREVGFSSEEITKGLGMDKGAKEDEAPEIPATARAVLGQIFDLGRHRLMCGDSTAPDQIQALMGERRAKMIFTDPPYLVKFEGSVNPDGSRSFNSGLGTIQNDDLNDEEGTDFFKKVVASIKQFVDGAFYICFSCRKIYVLLNALIENKITYRSIVIWNKGNFTLSMMDYKSNYEPIVYGWIKDHHFVGEKGERDIWEIDRTRKNDLHPTMKPIELCVRAITNSSLCDDIVLDLFLGSGSTLIACEQTGRICYGMEIDPKYCDVIIKRYCNLTGADPEAIYASAQNTKQEIPQCI